MVKWPHMAIWPTIKWLYRQHGEGTGSIVAEKYKQKKIRLAESTVLIL
jgi:hypothetical protein